jgi:general secretion pathway protein F
LKTFVYRGFDAHGRPVRGLVEASGLKDAREKLAAGGVLAEHLAATGREVRLSLAERAGVYRELAELLRAGMPPAAALDFAIESPELRRARLCLASVRDRVREGAALADAWAAATPSAEGFERAILAAAERVSALAPMLARLADALDERQRLRQRVRSAMIYPAIVVCVGLCVAFVMLGVLLPRTRAILGGDQAALPAVTRVMMVFGDWALRWGGAAALAAAAGGLVLRRAVRAGGAARLAWDRLQPRLPVVGRGVLLLARERFCRALGLLLEGGVPVVDALSVAGDATGNVWIAARIETAAEAVRHGERLSEVVAAVPALGPALAGWIRIGEAGGGLPGLLDAAADRLAAQWERRVGLCLSLLEPALILAIGAFVMLVTLAVLLPIFGLSRGL